MPTIFFRVENCRATIWGSSSLMKMELIKKKKTFYKQALLYIHEYLSFEFRTLLKPNIIKLYHNQFIKKLFIGINWGVFFYLIVISVAVKVPENKNHAFHFIIIRISNQQLLTESQKKFPQKHAKFSVVKCWNIINNDPENNFSSRLHFISLFLKKSWLFVRFFNLFLLSWPCPTCNAHLSRSYFFW